MRTVKINIDNIDKVKEFCKNAGKYIDNLDLVSGRYIVDAKSIMGIFSLDISKTIELTIHGDDENAIARFLESIDKFIIK